MAFVRIPGLPGKVYVPDKKKGHSCKHPCKDCFSCEFCSDDRCRLCMRTVRPVPNPDHPKT